MLLELKNPEQFNHQLNGLILSSKDGKSVKTETIASNIAIPVNTPK